jgi:hypothetical protein
MPMRVVERASDFTGYAQRFVNGQLALTIETRAKRFASDVWHDVVQLAVGLAGVVNRKYVRVTEVRGEVYLATESLRTEGKAHIGQEDFDRYFPIVLEILG